MLVPQAFNITQRSWTIRLFFNHNPNPKGDDITWSLEIRKEGGDGGGDASGGVGGDVSGNVGGDVGGTGVGGADSGGSGSGGSSGGGYGGSQGGGATSQDGEEIGTSSEGGPGPAVVSGRGGGSGVVIPNGNPFAGRIAGGGTRGEIYGDSHYGSGYPDTTGNGTAGRGFPFYFWPIVWAGNGTGYLYPAEYGLPTNTSRPGGPLTTVSFLSNSTNTTFRIISDNQTIIDLIRTIAVPCSSSLQTTNVTPTAYNESSILPKPEQAIQYYRASSIVLTLDGYNNTADFVNGTSDVPLPSNIDHTLLNCVNTTIGMTAPLVNVALVSGTAPTYGLLWLVWIVWMVLYL